MEDFLIKSILCQIILLSLYYLILEREKMHQFNRFFLLFSLFISFVIPLITIEIYEELITLPSQNQSTFKIPQVIDSEVLQKQSEFDVSLLLWSSYILVTFILSIRFALNLYKISQRIKLNPKEIYRESILVLVSEKILPHTFFHYIFINKEDHKNSEIEAELYTHELTHAREKHSFDVILIEILKTVFWFNPIFILYKKAIQLNHEFLADENVVATYNVSFYQNLLLEKASWRNNFQLVSNLNFLVTKKRLIMMTKTTSKKMALLKKLAIVPLLSGIIYFTCTKTVAQEKKQSVEKTNDDENDDKEKRRSQYFAGVRFIIYEKGIQTKNKIVGENIIFDKLYEELTPEDKKQHFEAFLHTQDGFKKNSPTIQELKDFKNSKKYAIWIDGKNVQNTELNKFKPSDIAYFSGSVILKNARTKKHPQPFQYWFYSHTYYDKNEMGKPVDKYSNDKFEIFQKIVKS